MEKKQLKKTAITVATVAAVAFGSGFAYLTATDSTSNLFTVNGGQDGDFGNELHEDNWPKVDTDGDGVWEDVPTKDSDGNPIVDKLIPNQEVLKDPRVENTGKEEEITFLSIKVPVKNVTLINDDGTKGVKKLQEIFYMKDAADTIQQHRNNFDFLTEDAEADPVDNVLGNWYELTDYEVNTPDGSGNFADGTTYRTYVFGYKTMINPDESTTTLFDKVQLKNIYNAEMNSQEVNNIDITAYSIQAKDVIGLTGVTEGEQSRINVEDGLSYDELNEIFSIYLNSEGVDEDIINYTVPTPRP